MTRRVARVVWTTSLLLAGSPAAASAEGGAAPDAAEALFQQGKALLDTGRLEEACRVLEESNHLQPAGGTLLNLASCRERLGQYASAERALQSARALAEKAGRDDAIKFVDDRLAAIRPNVSVLRLELPPSHALQKTTLEVDGKATPLAGRSLALRLDPGAHQLLVETAGRIWRRSVDLPGAGKELTVALIPPEVPPGPPALGPPLVRAPLRPDPFEPFAVAALSLGGGMVVGGAVAGGFALDAWSQASSRCPAAQCADPVGVTRAAEAGVYADVSTGLLVAGGAVVAVGVVLLAIPRVTGGKPKGAQSPLRFTF